MSSSASQYRALLWFFTIAGLVSFWPMLEGARGHLPSSLGLLSGGLSVLCFFTGGYFGWKGAQIRIAERDKRADALALITLAAFLKDKTAEELETAVSKGGPAGEAAAMVLQRRKEGLRPSGTQQTMH